jgi:hypothetical protein
MKVFIYLLLFIAMILIYTGSTFSQSVSINYPHNGQVVTDDQSQYSNETSIWVKCETGYIASQYPPNYSVDQYIILYANGGVYNSQNTGVLDYDFYLEPGTYTFRVDLYELFLGNSSYLKTASSSITFYVKHTISVANDFGSGNVNIDGSQKSSGSNTYKFIGDILNVGAIDQTDGSGSQWIWNTSGTYNSNWQRRPMTGNPTNISGATARNYNYTVASNDNGATIIAGLRKICKIKFQNNFTSVGNGGTIDVNGSQYGSPTSDFNVTQQNPITGTSIDQKINGISYAFANWSNSSTSSNTTFYPNDNITYTSNYTGTPDNSGLNFGYDISVGHPIKMHWTDNPNSNVTYQIWRNYKGSTQGPVKIATVQKGVQTYTDQDYDFTGTYTDDLLYYDVREYYSVEGTSTTPVWHAVYGKMALKTSNPTASLNTNDIKDYTLSCYPNPFNPSTLIHYEIPNDGLVILKIYDNIGQEVRTLVNQYQTKGRYDINFNAGNLASGIYFYRLQSGRFVSTKKMLLLK